MEISRQTALGLLADKEAVDNHLQVAARALELDERSTLFKLRAEERTNIIQMRKSWSCWILRAILLVVIADILLIFLLGFGVLSFRDQWYVPAFIAESLMKVLGLAWIIVKFLFGKDSLES